MWGMISGHVEFKWESEMVAQSAKIEPWAQFYPENLFGYKAL
jgi:hypothetical protein